MMAGARSGKGFLAVVVTIVVAAAVAAGVVMMGPPSEERARRLDDRRVADLQRWSSAVRLFRQRHGRLPASLDELAEEPGVAGAGRDPVTGDGYAYRALDTERFELCATFERPSTSSRGASFWSHGSGRQCFVAKTSDER